MLTDRLVNEVNCLRKVTGEFGGVIIEGIVIVASTIFVTIYFSWQLALINIAFMPVQMTAEAIEVSSVPCLDESKPL